MSNLDGTARCPACTKPSGIFVGWDKVGAGGLKCNACGVALEVRFEQSGTREPDDDSGAK